MSNNVASPQSLVDAAFEQPALLEDPVYEEAVRHTIDQLDRGEIRVAHPQDSTADYLVHAWIKRAILLYFRIQKLESSTVGPYEYHDKIPLKTGYAAAGVRVVPPAVARYGSFIERGAVLMPSYINIGAWVGSGTMVDTWATVGSCAQIGRNVHLSGGVGIGGVLEPPGATPVIIEDGAFIGSRAIVVEGVHIGAEAVLAANVTLTASTPIIDVTGTEAVTYKGKVPPRSVVIPGTRAKSFPSGEYQLAAALIIGRRKESTDRRTSLNDALRDFSLSV